jgi:EAL domain-containing protein (putative c-di-GMP-specific phosphodiesterase class I)
MKLPRLRHPEAVTSDEIFRFVSLCLYAMLLLYAVLTQQDVPAYTTVVVPALLLVVAMARYSRTGRQEPLQRWLLVELGVAIFAVCSLALQKPGQGFPWLVGLAGIFPLAFEVSMAFLAVAAISITGLFLNIGAGIPAVEWPPYLFVTMFAGLSTMLLSHALHLNLLTQQHTPSSSAHGDTDTGHALPHRTQINRALRSALARNELSVVYQPKVSVADGSLKGFESLLRWNSAKYGNIPPVDFIPVAESSGLVIPIGLWVLEQSCQQLSQWQAEYPQARLTISVNVSMRQLLHETFIDEVAAILERTGVDPQAVELEITETSAMTRPARTVENLTRLKQLGLRLALDDFGTGYSSLAYLQKLPVDVLKIDKAFVQGLDKNANDIGIVRAILALAHTLNFETVAEGVETKENVEQLKKMGCSLAQGFVFSEAVNAETAENMLRVPQQFAVG